MKRHLSLAVVLVMAGLLLAACGAKQSSQGTAGTSPKASASAAPGASQAPAASQAPSGSKDEMTMKVSISITMKDTWGVAATKWQEDLEKKSNGKIKLKLYPNESLSNGNFPKGLEAVQNGSTEISLHSFLIYGALDPKLFAPNVPFLIPTYERADKTMQGEAGKKLADVIRTKGIEVLAFGESGYRQITNSKRAITKPDDLKGLKIRIPSNAMLVDAFKTFGADPTVMNMPEVFTSLQQGVIDGQENPLPIIFNAKFAEVTKHLSMWNYVYDPIVFGMNKKLYDSLDPASQKLMKDTAQDAAKYQIEINRKQAAELSAELKKQGMTITELTPDQVKAFQDKVKPVIDKYEASIGKDILDAFRN